MNLVVGSGPAGVACAAALLARGQSVRMIDGGLVLEPHRRQTIQRMAGVAPERWATEDVALIKEGMALRHGNVPLKRAYGSDFAFRDADRVMPVDRQGADVRSSLALGGLSNVWGATLLPYRADDLRDWPIQPAQLGPHYAAVAALLDVASVHDDLSNEFPIGATATGNLAPSQQGAQMLERLQSHRAELRRAGITFGRSRLAVRAHDSADGPGCVHCGLCIYGCPNSAIYNSAATLSRLLSRPGFTYTPGIVVRRLRETAGRIDLEVENSEGGEAVIEASRVYLGAGALASTRIVLESLEAFDETLLLRDSQYFVIPLVQHRRVRGSSRERLHTLSQVFVEMLRSDVSRHNVHLQIYGYNDLFEQLPGLKWLPAPMRRLATERLLIAQGYLHSSESPAVSVSLTREPGSNDRSVLRLRASGREQSVRRVRGVARAMRQRRTEFGATAVGLLAEVPESGRGYHCGGTLPMRSNPSRFETDTLGRPFGFSRLHVVDASVFPSVPSAPITFSVMANAHRIGSEDLRA